VHQQPLQPILTHSQVAAERLRTSVLMLLHSQTWMAMLPFHTGARARTTVLQIAP